MEAKAYFGPDNVKILATQNGDGFDVIYLASMTSVRMTAQELAEFKAGSQYRRYGNGYTARVKRAAYDRNVPQFDDDGGALPDLVESVVEYADHTGKVHTIPAADWDTWLQETFK
jgi:hypothetical protein